jgi:hypothetical protein
MEPSTHRHQTESGTSGLRQVNPIGGAKMAAGMIGSRCENTVKETDMSKAVNTLYQSIEALDGRLQVLVSRLNSVLVSKPKCAEEKKDNELTQCSLAKSIRGAVQHLDKLQGIINDTLEDLEI